MFPSASFGTTRGPVPKIVRLIDARPVPYRQDVLARPRPRAGLRDQFERLLGEAEIRMAQKIEWSFKVSVGGGPELSSSRILAVDAYEAADVVVKSTDAPDKEIVLPSPIQALVLTANDYENITYKINSSSSTDVFKLDQPLVMMGSGAMAQLNGGTAITSLFVTNGGSSDVRMNILIGRDITP